MENFLDKKYNAVELAILAEIDPQIEIEDNSFSYSYGSINGVQKQIDITVENETLTFIKDYSSKCIDWIMTGIQDNIDLYRNVNGYELSGSLRYEINKMFYTIFIEWKIVGYDNY